MSSRFTVHLTWKIQKEKMEGKTVAIKISLCAYDWPSMRKYEEAKKSRFQRVDYFNQLYDAYIHYHMTKLTSDMPESIKDEICSMATKYYFENPVLGIKFLKICWYKLKKSIYALDIV